VYVTSQDNNRYAFDTVTDDERRASEIGATLVGPLTVADASVYVGTAGNALAALGRRNRGIGEKTDTTSIPRRAKRAVVSPAATAGSGRQF
jgi:hypothetical protein